MISTGSSMNCSLSLTWISSNGIARDIPHLLKNFLNSFMAMAYSSSSLSEEVIENGATLLKNHVVEGVNREMPITTAEEKAQRRNKADLDTMSIDDLYNNLKVYEPEVKGMFSSNLNTQNMAFLSLTNSSTNGEVNTANGVSTASTQVNDAFSTNIDNLSDVVIYAFLASQLNSPQLAHEDLGQIHPDDMEEIDLRWKRAMLTMRARKFLKKANCIAELQEIKTTSTRKAQEGVCLWKHLLLQLWCHVMILVDMIGVISLDEFVVKPIVENKSSKDETKAGNLQIDLQDKGVIDSGCSSHMTRNMSYLTDYEEIDKGYVAFGGNPKRGKITRKCTIKTDFKDFNEGYVTFGGGANGGRITGKGTINMDYLNFKDMYFVKELKFNLFSVSQIKAFRVFNSRTRIVEENLHIRLSKNIPNVVGSGLDWLFDIDALTRTMNYEPNVADNELPFDPNIPALEDVSIFNFSNDDEDDDIVADMNNIDTTIQVNPVPTTRIHKDHPLDQVIKDLHLTTQTRQMSNNLEEHGFVSTF
nr:hypothetical protein [Tanacetum cinerariifolium]